VSSNCVVQPSGTEGGGGPGGGAKDIKGYQKGFLNGYAEIQIEIKSQR
jgi:hypothetical protein